MQSKYHVLGMMSGTSLDGLDLAYCSFEFGADGKWMYELLESETIAYDQAWKDRLDNAIHCNAVELSVLHHSYGTWLGEQAAAFIRRKAIKPEFISSHGHTVFHQPELGFTLQIGSGQHLALEAGIPVICDFRSLDVMLGGQGAPLVPIGDRLLFGEYDYCLNLGGISNVSFEREAQRLAYDIGPANMLLNYLVGKLGLAYDKDGLMAKSGEIDQQLLDELNQLKYYQLAFPKSLGREWFDACCIPILEGADSSLKDQLHTACHHIVQQLAAAIKGIHPQAATTRLLITGGGAKNGFLMELLQQYLPDSVYIFIPEEQLIDFKEAIVFALLGVLKKRNEINTLHTVTGAKRSESGGQIYYPKYAGE